MGRLGPHSSPTPSCTLDPREEGSLIPIPCPDPGPQWKDEGFAWLGRQRPAHLGGLVESTACVPLREQRESDGTLLDLPSMSPGLM